ncbi:hypothetical protein U91I_01556 [alpha proteobacterium U9-1i]|nr:hypothetical protein U91I_01556 [alpha proteobacterium U9-1i]
MAQSLEQKEADLFTAHPLGAAEPTAIFILGSPRTGSTPFFQAVVAAFSLPYISNFANTETPNQPAIGILKSHAARAPASFKSAYGKIAGMDAPSEGSAVMLNWCGGGHPSEIVSAAVLPGKAAHLRATLRAVESATGAPLVIKNAWNCFRLGSLAAVLPRAGFIWIRRDIGKAAASDLAARYATKSDANAWNSATPRNIAELQKLPYWEQVVENQAAFARAISEAAASLAPARFVEVWWEDFVRDPNAELAKLASRLEIAKERALSTLDSEAFSSEREGDLPEQDAVRIQAFIDANARFAPLRRS